MSGSSEIAEDTKRHRGWILACEHLWAKKLNKVARANDGLVLANGFIRPGELVVLGALLERAAEAAESIELE